MRLKKGVVFVHRWMGVCVCLLFLMWFTSGIVMMYWSYPEVSAEERLSREPALDARQIRISPAQAWARAGIDSPVNEARLAMLDRRPAYRFEFDRGETIVYADTGEEQKEFAPEFTRRVAAQWTGQPAPDAREEENTEEDQWTVSGEFRELRPMMKYTWPDGEEVYVSTVTGEVAQYTTRGSRMAAYFGAIPHWVYFTELRKHARRWSRVVIWASGFAAVAAALGLVAGAWMYSPSKRFEYAGAPSRIPYRGQKRWHMILGLIFGAFACTWAFSGMLSMDPFPQWQSGNAEEIGFRLQAGLRGGALGLPAFDEKTPREALEAAGANSKTKELELVRFAGESAYLAVTGPHETRVVPVRGEPAEEFDRGKIIEALRETARLATVTETRLVTKQEAYYSSRQGELPLPAIFVQLNDAGRSMFYVDPKTARIVRGYDAKSRWNRWLYHGLHSMDGPWLYAHRPAWDIVVLALLGGGISLCVTSLLMAWGVVRRKLEMRM